MSQTRFLVVTHIFSQTGEDAFCRWNVWRASGTNRIFHFLNFFSLAKTDVRGAKQKKEEIIFLQILHIFQKQCTHILCESVYIWGNIHPKLISKNVRRDGGGGTGEREPNLESSLRQFVFPSSPPPPTPPASYSRSISRKFFSPLLLLSSSSDQASPQHIIKADTYTCVVTPSQTLCSREAVSDTKQKQNSIFNAFPQLV